MWCFLSKLRVKSVFTFRAMAYFYLTLLFSFINSSPLTAFHLRVVALLLLFRLNNQWYFTEKTKKYTNFSIQWSLDLKMLFLSQKAVWC